MQNVQDVPDTCGRSAACRRCSSGPLLLGWKGLWGTGTIAPADRVRAGVTAGRSLAANIALAKHNARIAADIAVAFAGNPS